MITSDLSSLNTVTVDLVGGDRIFRQGSTIKRIYLVKVAGVATSLTFLTPPSANLGIRCQVRDANNDTLAMSATGTVETGLGTGYFSITFSASDTESVTPAAGFTFVEEEIAGRTWLVFNGVYDVEFFDNTAPPEIVGCPVQGKIKMRRGATR